MFCEIIHHCLILQDLEITAADAGKVTDHNSIKKFRRDDGGTVCLLGGGVTLFLVFIIIIMFVSFYLG